jgi:hypothetical protein
MLTATGGSPAMATAGFVPVYPTQGLPGNVHPGLKVDLLPLGSEALNTFMQIELPAHQPLALTAVEIFPTIGDFYNALANAFQTLKPAMADGKQVETDVNGHPLVAITSVDAALNAIDEIKEQGEGTTSSPFEGTFDLNQLAHFYTFKQIAMGHKLQQDADGVFRFDGPAIPMPDVFQFASSANPGESGPFNIVLSDLLRLLEKTWSIDPKAIDAAVGKMFTLADAGRTLIQNGIRPEFRWTDETGLL